MKINKIQSNIIIASISLIIIISFYFIYYSPYQNKLDIQNENITNLKQWLNKGKTLESEQDEYFTFLTKKEKSYEQIYQEKIDEVTNVLPTNFSEPEILNALTDLSNKTKVDLQISKPEITSFTTKEQNFVQDGPLKIQFNEINEIENNKETDTDKTIISVILTLTNSGNQDFPIKATEDYTLKTNSSEYKGNLNANNKFNFNINDKIKKNQSQKIELLFKISDKEITKELKIKKILEIGNEPTVQNETNSITDFETLSFDKEDINLENNITQIKYNITTKSEYRSLIFFMYSLQNLKMINKVENFYIGYNDEIFYPNKINSSLIERYNDFPLKGNFDLIFYTK